MHGCRYTDIDLDNGGILSKIRKAFELVVWARLDSSRSHKRQETGAWYNAAEEEPLLMSHSFNRVSAGWLLFQRAAHFSSCVSLLFKSTPTPSLHLIDLNQGHASTTLGKRYPLSFFPFVCPVYCAWSGVTCSGGSCPCHRLSVEVKYKQRLKAWRITFVWNHYDLLQLTAHMTVLKLWAGRVACAQTGDGARQSDTSVSLLSQDRRNRDRAGGFGARDGRAATQCTS